MECATCRKWLCQRVTDYEDGTRIVNLQTAEGRGKCDVLDHETPADFGCNRYEHGLEHVEIMGKKPGSPWHHSKWGTCPECAGVGYGCRRCAGTGRVLYYDDGYVGEEQTRRHPNEAKIGPPPKPKCVGCDRDIDPTWVACPHCGVSTNQVKVADPVRVADPINASNHPRLS
jgi:hypothetical protein